MTQRPKGGLGPVVERLELASYSQSGNVAEAQESEVPKPRTVGQGVFAVIRNTSEGTSDGSPAELSAEEQQETTLAPRKPLLETPKLDTSHYPTVGLGWPDTVPDKPVKRGVVLLLTLIKLHDDRVIDLRGPKDVTNDCLDTMLSIS